MIFKPYHIYPMHIGMKTVTRRVWLRKHASIHRWVDVTHKMFYAPEDVVGQIYIESITQQPLVRMTDADAYDEGGYDLKTYKAVLKEINAATQNRNQLTDETFVWVIKFRFQLSDIIDGNGGTADIDHYRDLWVKHMVRHGLQPRLVGGSCSSEWIIGKVEDGSSVQNTL